MQAERGYSVERPPANARMRDLRVILAHPQYTTISVQ